MRVPVATAATHELMIMRLALNFDAPGIVQLLRENAPELEIVHSSAPSAVLQDVEVLLTPAAGASNLSELLAACPRLKWIHVLGTGVDDFPLELVGDQVLAVRMLRAHDDEVAQRPRVGARRHRTTHPEAVAGATLDPPESHAHQPAGPSRHGRGSPARQKSWRERRLR